MAEGLTLSVTLIALILTLWLGYRAPGPYLFAALVPLSVILLPVAEEHHFVVLLIPIFMAISKILGDAWLRRLLSGPGVMLIAAILLLIAPIPYEAVRLGRAGGLCWPTPGSMVGWLLWGAIVWSLLARQSQLDLPQIAKLSNCPEIT